MRLAIGRSGALLPPSVSVAGGITLDLQVLNATSVAHVLEIRDGGGTFHVAAHGRASATLPHLKNGTYTLLVDGAPHGVLIVGAQAGP